jgi:hypothetical protein
MVLQYGIPCLWAGDVNNSNYIDNADFTLFNVTLKSNLNGYMASDLNMDGVINNKDEVFVDKNSKLGLISPVYFFREKK